MSVLLTLGSHGPGVTQLETRLAELGLYGGSVDGAFGTDLESAVIAFQKSQGLTPDGTVGDNTWNALFPAANSLADAPVLNRCVALTGAFETSCSVPECYAGLCGDFDGQGLSLGVAQWNVGQGTLQPMISAMITNHPDVSEAIFQDQLPTLRTWLTQPVAAQLQFVRSIQDPVHHTINDPWKSMFKAMARSPEFQEIQVEHAADMHRAALALCSRFGVTTDRAVALMFDIRVQNGSINAATEAKIRADFAQLPADSAPMDLEVAKLRSIANRRAEAASPEFVEDVRTRKLAIANGGGVVHGVTYDLEKQFGIGLRTSE